jgi:precorrin-6B methylase 2
MVQLTKNEIKALQVCIDTSITAEDMIQDAGRIMAGLLEMMKALGWNKKQVTAITVMVISFGPAKKGTGQHMLL